MHHSKMKSPPFCKTRTNTSFYGYLKVFLNLPV